MIRTDKEYEELKIRLSKADTLLSGQRESLAQEGLSKAEIERVMAPTISFNMQLQEELKFYKKLKTGKIPSVSSFDTVGQMLIALRIAKGLTQRALVGSMLPFGVAVMHKLVLAETACCELSSPMSVF